jgi:hypothetical protein
VDVKAFINIEVDAKNEKQARVLADAWVESLTFDEDIRSPIEPGCFVVDGTSDVEDLGDDEICGQCNDPRCDGCVPFDTPSLDTSFHDHEMDV